MIHDGIHFRAVRTIVWLSDGYSMENSSLSDEQIDALVADGTLPRKPHMGYLIPGRIVPEGTKGAVLAKGWTRDGQAVHAKPMKVEGWSKTNMIYVEDKGRSRVVLFSNGRAFIG